jgi:hypothetical protein
MFCPEFRNGFGFLQHIPIATFVNARGEDYLRTPRKCARRTYDGPRSPTAATVLAAATGIGCTKKHNTPGIEMPGVL